VCGDLGSVELDSKVAEIIHGVLELAEFWLREEDLENGVAGLHVCLSPLLCIDVVELQGSYTGTSHRQICGVEDVTSFSVEIL